MSSSRWRTPDLARSFLEGVRGAIPLASVQIEVILHLIGSWKPEAAECLDLGCGDGALGRAVLERFSNCHLTFLDFSPPMLEALRKRLTPGSGCDVLESDFSTPRWQLALEDRRFDIVVSGFSIHHQPDARKQELYSEIFGLLGPGGIFLNLEHVSSPSRAVETAHDEWFVDHLFTFHSRKNPRIDRDQIVRDYYDRPDKNENILAPVTTQCEWLEEIGFVDVDCYFKIFELALFGGRRPRENEE